MNVQTGPLAQPFFQAFVRVLFQRQIQFKGAGCHLDSPLSHQGPRPAWCPELRNLLVLRSRVALGTQIGGSPGGLQGAQSPSFRPECPALEMLEDLCAT